jgi:hypothetical protein
MSDKATPRPWVKSRYLGGACAIDNVNGCGDRLRHIADVFDPEDAALVLAAVNAYEAHQRAAQALRALVEIVEKAGLMQLSRGVELGPTVWFVKASERMEYAQAALAELDKLEGRP